MAVTSTWYPSAFAKMFNNDFNDGDVFKVALLGSAGTYNAAHTAWSDVSANEISGAGYTTGGAVVTLSASATSTKTEFTLGSVEWVAATITFSHAVVYQATSGMLMLHINFDGAQTVSSQNFILNTPSTKPSITP
jgi:hypothetical protein